MLAFKVVEAGANEAARRIRRETWKAMEQALADKKCKYIGVSNYPAELLEEMKEYATVMPAVNQLELHPRFASPKLQAVAKELGVVLTAYGSGTSLNMKDNEKVMNTMERIAKKNGRSVTAVNLCWTLQKGIAVIPRSASEEHIKENLQALDFKLSDEDMAELDQLDEAYPYYWNPVASVNAL